VIVRLLKEIEGTSRDVAWGNGQSRRLLLARDGVGFSLTDTVINAGSESRIHYKNHMEACYCISGRGEVECDGKSYPLEPGTMYALNAHDAHILRATETMRLVCVFVPPLEGEEAHSFDGNKPSVY
jgi:L-ectoine synthase